MSQPLAFTFVTPWYHHFCGGAEVAIRMFAEQLDQRGFDVEVLTSCCRSPYESWWKNVLPEGLDQINGISVRRFAIDLQGESVLSRLDARRSKGETLDEETQREYVRHMFNSPALIEYARQHTAGRMIIAAPYPFGMVNQLASVLAGRVSLMSCLHDEPWLAWVTTRDTLAASQRMLYLTEEEKTLAVRHFGRHVGRSLVESPVTGLGVELPPDIQALVADERRRRAVCAEYQLAPNYFIYVGRKDVGKNLPTLVEWFRDYRRQGGQSELVVAGSGDDSLVPREAGFRNLGFVSDEAKYSLIADSLGLINLSLHESFSIVMMEAWLCRVPVVVAADCEVTAAHCLKSGGGLAVGGSQQFIKALQAIEQPAVRKAMANSGLTYTQENYCWDTVLGRLLRGAA